MPAVRRGSSKKGWSPVCRVQTGFHQRLFLEHTRAITAKLLGAKDIRNVAKFSPTTPDNQSINQSIYMIISRHSTEARGTVRLCRIKEKCLKTDFKCVNGWSSSTVQWKRVPKSRSSNRETTSSSVQIVRRNWQTEIGAKTQVLLLGHHVCPWSIECGRDRNLWCVIIVIIIIIIIIIIIFIPSSVKIPRVKSKVKSKRKAEVVTPRH